MKASSQDLRRRVLRAIDQGKSQAEGAKIFAISPATIKRYRHSPAEREAMFCPNPFQGVRASRERPYRLVSREQLRTNPDASREQHCQMWEASHGIKVSPASISRARMALGWTRKKPSVQ